MNPTMTRRRFGALVGATVAGGVMMTHTGLALAAQAADAVTEKLAALEKSLDARLGVFILDTHTGDHWARRSQERFPLCSTFKLLASGAVLARVDAGQETLNRRVRFEASDLVSYSPVTENRVGGDGMTLAELCKAAITRSDNTAGNLLLESLGGPVGVTDFARSLGDSVTRLDRWETALNEATPGDPRDTTTPAAMAANLQTLVLGNHLSPASREQLTAWLVANRTGDAKLRAGLPGTWRVGDKTGGGDHGTMNEVAVIWPPGRNPLIVSIYITETDAPFDTRNAAIADIGRTLKSTLTT